MYPLSSVKTVLSTQWWPLHMFPLIHWAGAKQGSSGLLYLWIFWLCYFRGPEFVREIDYEDGCSLYNCSGEGFFLLLFMSTYSQFPPISCWDNCSFSACYIPKAGWGPRIQSNSKHSHYSQRISRYCYKVTKSNNFSSEFFWFKLKCVGRQFHILIVKQVLSSSNESSISWNANLRAGWLVLITLHYYTTLHFLSLIT